ncbi:MAG: hypothetical protein MI741_20205, partial [Rhodospirillales bacterium]|nr:hypothetical protein [Rhodospirillales bacterium]
DGVVDAADYTIWRDNRGATSDTDTKTGDGLSQVTQSQTTGFYELTVAIDGAASNADSDTFEVLVNPADSLTVTVVGLAPDMFLQLELLDEFGSVVASDFATGSNNAQLTVNVPGGTAANAAYAVRIASQVDAQGAYVVDVDGATGSSQPTVNFISLPVRFPDALPDFVSYPTFASVYLTDAVDPASVDLSDLQITGPGGETLGASSFELIGGAQIRFQILSANVGSGEYTLGIATGALVDQNGNNIVGQSRTFTYREEGPRVVSSTLPDGSTFLDGAVLEPGGLTHTVGFSEPLLDFVSAGIFGFVVLTAEDVELTNLLTDEVRNPVNFLYSTSPSPRTESVFAQLDEGVYELRYLATDPNGLEIHFSAEDDRFPLDGSPSTTLPSGDGNLGDDFVVRFSVDRNANTPLPMFDAVGPKGGQVFTHEPLRAAIGEASDVDTFLLDADAGQTLALKLEPLDPSLQMRVRVLDPGGAELLDVQASGAGESLLIQPTDLPVAGEYTLEFSGVAGIGGFE